MKQTRQVLTIALVTAALCADRAIASAPTPRTTSASVAGRLVSRLSVSFQRTVPTVRVYQNRRDGLIQNQPKTWLPAEQAKLPDTSVLSPLLTCLPPPSR